MPRFSPIQAGFRGEITPRAHGRVDLEDVFRYGLAHCSNFRPTPQGSLLMRCGTKDGGLVAGAVKLIPFTTSAGNFVLILSNQKVKVFSLATGAIVAMSPNLITNGHFDADLSGWASSGSGVSVSLGAANLSTPLNGGSSISQVVPTIAGQAYTVRFKARGSSYDIFRNMGLYINGVGTPVYLNGVQAVFLSASVGFLEYTAQFVAAGANTTIGFTSIAGNMGNSEDYTFSIDDVSLTRDAGGTVTEMDAPWTAAQLPDVQYDEEPSENRLILVHGSVAPYVFSFIEPNAWEMYQASFFNQPVEWGPGNYPSIVECGFQGRQWFGATPNQRHKVWYSRSGASFDFSTGTDTDDSSSFTVSTKGTLRWMRGQKTLLAGAEKIEHSIGGNGTVIAPGNVNVEDESAYGSAPAMAAHLGDEIVFIGRDRRTVRALSYDAQTKAGWVARAISFFGEHLLSGIKEIHFVRSPDPTMLLVSNSGTLVACGYDRAAKVIAWWRLGVGAVVGSGAGTENDDGGAFWLLVEREDGTHIEVLPLHENGVDYLDSWAEAVVGLGQVAGLERFEGLDVKVKADGVLVGTFTVNAGSIDLGTDEYDGTTVVVGLPYRAKATTLPIEGGNPAGTSQGLAVHWSEIIARLSNSARPLINNERASLGKAFGGSFDKLEGLITKDVRVSNMDVQPGGQIDIEQDAPFRTEVCGIFGTAEVS